jgi:RecA/RadA recombinase
MNLPKIETNFREIERIPTGLYSFDHSIPFQNNTGLPLNIITEIYGREHIGKSTLAYYLSGVVAKHITPDGIISLCDFEGLDINYLAHAVGMGGFEGTIKTIDPIDVKGKARSHEDMLGEFVVTLKDEKTSCGIVDSIGAIQTTEEEASNLEEGFGAKRAVIVSKFVRKLNSLMRAKESPVNAFLINHAHTAVMGFGHNSSGGVALKHLAILRIFMIPSSADNIKSGDDVLANVVEGRIEKLRYGGNGGRFKFVTIPGYGVRSNLTAVIDCIDLGIASRGSTIKMDDKSFGYFSGLVQADLEGRLDKFEPFFEALKKHKKEEGSV